MHTLPPFSVFGSEDSQDYDVLFYVPQQALGDLVGMIALSKDLNARLEAAMALDRRYSWKPKPVNANLALIDPHQGIVTQVFKGTWDEVNNAVYHTYRYHNQVHSRYVTQLVERDVPAKVIRTCRVILSMLSRTHHRALVKGVLGGSLAQQTAALRQIDLAEFHSLTSLGKRNVSVEDYFKVLAFQYGQTLGLMHHAPVELYTKRDIAHYYPDLEPLLYREPGDRAGYARVLEEKKHWLLGETDRLFTPDHQAQLYEQLPT